MKKQENGNGTNVGEAASENLLRREIRKNYDAKYARISIYVILTVMIIYGLIRFFDNFTGVASVFGATIEWLGVLLRPLLIGFAIAYFLDPLAGRLEKMLNGLKKRLRKPNATKPLRSSRGLAVALTWLIVLAIIVFVASMIVSTISHSVQVVSLKSLDSLVYDFADTLKNFSKSITRALDKMSIPSGEVASFTQSIGEKISKGFSEAASNILVSLKNVTGVLSTLLFSVIFGIYFMLDGEGLKSYWGHVYHSLVSDSVSRRTNELVENADRVFSGYIRGQFLDGVFIAIVLTIALSLCGVKYAVIIGVLTGIGNLIPYLGSFIAYTTTILVCLVTFDFQKMFIAVIVILVAQTIDGNVVNPKLLSSSISIHPMLVIASLIIGATVGGLLGMFLAVPSGALLKIYFEKFIEHRAAKKRAGT
uniref:AI-2E family transporter n=1 Tax=Eubacterium cellulosolvens TaxID=29322 RepID=UPI00068586BE|nr:AI-2E family transporter [[Eubacterium] cellulosolvens]